MSLLGILTVSLLLGESGVLLVGLGIGQINLESGHIQIPAQNHGFLLIQGFEMFPHHGIPCHPFVQSYEFPAWNYYGRREKEDDYKSCRRVYWGECDQSVTCIGNVGRDQEEGVELGRDDSALVVVL